MAKRKSLQAILKDADESVRKAAAEALNKASDEIVARMKRNMTQQGIKVRTGRLVSSFRIRRATPSSLRTMISSEVYAPLPKKARAWRNAWTTASPWERMKLRRFVGRPTKYRYPAQGVPYGRIIEFSKRINKPFFYKSWYEERKKVVEEIVEKVGEAWSKG